MSETESASSSPPSGKKPSQKLIIGAAAGAVLLVLLLYFAFFAKAKGIFGQIRVDGKPASGVSITLKVIPEGAPEREETVSADSEGNFTLALSKGRYRLEPAGSKQGFLRVGSEELEVLLKKTPLWKNYEVSDELLTIPAIETAHPGSVIGPKDGERVLPDAKLAWTVYPNATHYLLFLNFMPQPSRMASGSVRLDGDATEWAFSFNDAMGRATELSVFGQFEKRHPEAAFMPGAAYSWKLLVFGENGQTKATEGPFSFTVAATQQAQDIAATSTAKAAEKAAEAQGALNGLVVRGADVVRNGSFRVTLLRKDRDSERIEQLTDVPVQTDSDGRFAIRLPVGIYRFLSAQARREDSLYDLLTGDATIILPASASAEFNVEPGVYTQVPDIQIKSRVKILFPTPGARVRKAGALSWAAYPEANRYQVTLAYLDKNGRPTNIWAAPIVGESASFDQVSVAEDFAKLHDHPAKGLKSGGRYRVQVMAFQEPKRKREWDLAQPPPPWIPLSESLQVEFLVE